MYVRLSRTACMRHAQVEPAAQLPNLRMATEGGREGGRGFNKALSSFPMTVISNLVTPDFFLPNHI